MARLNSSGSRVRRPLIAGVVDSGTASLATFLVGIFAANQLDPVVLGGYALAYSAVFLAGVIPLNLVLTPVEVSVVQQPTGERLAHLPGSMRLGAPVALLSGLAVSAWAFFAPAEISPAAVRGLTATAVAVAFVSPMQDHVRRMLHTGGASGSAALTSSVQLLVVLLGLTVGATRGVPAYWVPFGALALANVCSLFVGLLLGLRSTGDMDVPPPNLRILMRSGRWLLAAGSLGPATGFVAAALVARLAGAEALGHAEAARVVAQPVWVLAVGLSAVLAPRSIAAAQGLRRDAARRASSLFTISALAFGLLALVWFGFPWKGNPFYHLIPVAYAVSGLAFVSIVAELPLALSFPFRSEALGAHKEQALFKVEAGGAFLRVTAAASAAITGAFAIPLAKLTMALVRLFGFLYVARGIYRRKFDGDSRAA